MTDWPDVPFIDYWNAVEDLLKEQYGITTDDSTSGELVASAQEGLFTPQEYVDYIAAKYDLDRIDEGPYGTRIITT